MCPTPQGEDGHTVQPEPAAADHLPALADLTPMPASAETRQAPTVRPHQGYPFRTHARVPALSSAEAYEWRVVA